MGSSVSAGIAATAAVLSLAVAPAMQTRFSSHSDLVVLHVAVADDDGRAVSGLRGDAFTVLEDRVPQPLVVFSEDDTPATVGLVIDSSASMLALRDQVAAAAGEFVRTSGSADEIFALAFNEQVRTVLPASLPFTSDPDVLRAYLMRAFEGRGRTALYDAVAHGIGYVEKGTHPRKALVIVSDGGDNASASTLEDVQQALTASNTTVYAVALSHPGDPDGNPGLLKRLARTSGGVSFMPRAATGIAAALTAIAHDIHSTYTLAYVVPPGDPGVRHVQVTVRGPHGSLRARTRNEYLAR